MYLVKLLIKILLTLSAAIAVGFLIGLLRPRAMLTREDIRQLSESQQADS
jgi:hypothetical protein